MRRFDASRRSGRAALRAAIASSLLCLFAACGDDDPAKPKVANVPAVTEQQAGIWSLSTLVRDCSTNIVLGTDVWTDTLQVGEVWFDLEELNCSATVSGDTYHLECMREDAAGDSCSLIVRTDITLTMEPSSFMMHGSQTISQSPAGCSGTVNRCFRIAAQGTRTAGLP